MTDRLPELGPQDARREAEECLREDVASVDTGRATAFALLAVAGELHEIRKILGRKR